MDSRERFDETLPAKKEFYNNLAMKDIMDVDYKHAKREWKDFRIQNLGQ